MWLENVKNKLCWQYCLPECTQVCSRKQNQENSVQNKKQVQHMLLNLKDKHLKNVISSTPWRANLNVPHLILLNAHHYINFIYICPSSLMFFLKPKTLSYLNLSMALTLSTSLRESNGLDTPRSASNLLNFKIRKIHLKKIFLNYRFLKILYIKLISEKNWCF